MTLLDDVKGLFFGGQEIRPQDKGFSAKTTASSVSGTVTDEPPTPPKTNGGFNIGKSLGLAGQNPFIVVIFVVIIFIILVKAL